MVVASVRVRVKRSYMETPEMKAAIATKAVMPLLGEGVGGGMVGGFVFALRASRRVRLRKTASSRFRRTFGSAPEASAPCPACSIIQHDSDGRGLTSELGYRIVSK